jgi:hypothetical protein
LADTKRHEITERDTNKRERLTPGSHRRVTNVADLFHRKIKSDISKFGHLPTRPGQPARPWQTGGASVDV